MIPADYECRSCGHVFEYDKPYGQDFPKELACPECGEIATKMFKIGWTMCPAGNLGNGHVGY